MSNLFKSKTFKVGGLVIAVAMMLSVAASVSAATTTTTTTTTVVASAFTYSGVMKAGMSGPGISTLQAALNSVQTLQLVVDGKFGPATKAGVMAFQASHGLVADGIVGPKTGAALTAATVAVITIPSNFPAGCTSNAGFSTTTGQSCAVSMTLPAGCTSTAGFSPTTGMSCSASSGLPAGCTSTSGFSPTTGMSCGSGSTGVSGTNGYLSDFGSDSANRVSTVYESEMNKVVAGFRATARLSSQNVDRVRVTIVNAGTGSANLAKYITSATLWQDGTKLQTINVADASRGTSDDIFTFNFSGLHANIPKDQVGHFYLSVNAVSSLDSSDAINSSWTVSFVAGGVSASSPDGSYDTYPSTAITQTALKFGKFVSNGVKATVGLSSSNPAATSLAVNNTASTNGVTLLKFTVKATNSDLTLRKVPVQITSTTSNVANIVQTLKLYRGANLVDSVDGSAIVDVSGAGTTCNASDTSLASGLAGCYIFTNLSSPDNRITAGDTAEYSIVVDIKPQSNFTAGSTLVASIANADVLLAANFSVQDQNGDQLTDASSTIRVGSAVGEVMTLLVNGVNVVMGSPTITTTTDTGLVVSATYSIPFTATAFGNTLYLGPGVGRGTTTAVACSGANDQPGMTGAVATTCGLAFVIENSGNSVVTTGNTAVALSTTDASVETTGYRLDSGATKHFTLTVTLSKAAATGTGSAALAVPAFYKVRMAQVQTFTNGALSTGAAAQTLVPPQNYRTAPVNIQN